jgi:hypothetical protein
VTRARECVSVLVSFREATERDATGFDAPSADARRFILDVRSIFGYIFSHKKK